MATATSRAVNQQRVGHPVLNLRGSLSFFAKMHEYVDRSAVFSLAVHNDVKMHRMPVVEPEYTPGLIDLVIFQSGALEWLKCGRDITWQTLLAQIF
jgi:hypothetical protein